MTKPSMIEAPALGTHAHDPHGNQPLAHGDASSATSSSASASREIFQALFKDLGKQAMAMESILRLVCGKVDKLEHWVTEVSFGMTELDLKLRNIAHNIEGTAANVDDVPSTSRWAVPQDEEEVQPETVVKKVGVALHKKKQMRMTGMVANILDQLTTVTETPTAAESETESHASSHHGKGDDRKKTKTKAKKPTAGDTGDVLSPSSAVSASTTPREKTKTPKKKPHKHHTHAVAHAAADEPNEPPVLNEAAVIAEDLRSALEQQLQAATPIESHDEVASPADAPENVHESTEPQPLEARGEEVRPTLPNEGLADNEETPAAAELIVDKREDVDHEESDEVLHQSPRVETQGLPPETMVAENDVELQPAPIQALDAPTDDPQQPSTEDSTSQQAPDQGASVMRAEDEVTADTHPKAVESPREQVDHTTHKVTDEKQPHPRAPNPEPTTAPVAPEDTPANAVAVAPDENEVTTPIDVAVEPTPQQEDQLPKDVKHQEDRVPRNVEATPTFVPKETSESLSVSTCLPPPPQEGLVTAPLLDPTPVQSDQPAPLTKASSKRIRRGTADTAIDGVSASSPTNKGRRRASIRKSVAQRQPSVKRRQAQDQLQQPPLQEETNSTTATSRVAQLQAPQSTAASQPVDAEVVPKSHLSVEDDGVEIPSTRPSATVVTTEQQPPIEVQPAEDNNNGSNASDGRNDDGVGSGDDDDDDDDSSSLVSSDSDESVLDLVAPIAAKTDNPSNTSAEKRMTMKMTRTLTALKKLKKADVLTPEEIAELKQRAHQKWFKLRDHIKEKNKKDVANILLKRKKNIFTVSNRIELLEEKSREVFASIKQFNTDLKGKVEMSTFEGLRRHVHDLHVSLLVLDEKVSKGNTPAMDHIKQLAKDTEAMRLFLLEQIALGREHCDGNHRETMTMFDEQWMRVQAIEQSIHDKLAALVAEYDDKLHDLPDYTDALEGVRRAIRKKADIKAFRELEARLLGHDADSEDCLIRCLSCHKEVVNGGNESLPADDNDATGTGSPHLKRVNPGAASARVYRSNVPLNAQPLGIPDLSVEQAGHGTSDEIAQPNATMTVPTSKPLTPSRRATRNEEPKPSPLTFIHVTATKALPSTQDAYRPISAPASALKKKSQAKQ